MKGIEKFAEEVKYIIDLNKAEQNAEFEFITDMNKKGYVLKDAYYSTSEHKILVFEK